MFWSCGNAKQDDPRLSSSQSLPFCGRADDWQADAEVSGDGVSGIGSPATLDAKEGGEARLNGMATLDTDPQNRWLDRLLARLGMIDDAEPLFADAERVPRAGVLLALPLFVRAGVLDVFMKTYRTLGPAFYGLRTTVVCLFLLAVSDRVFSRISGLV
jgi:hypothetical protein